MDPSTPQSEISRQRRTQLDRLNDMSSSDKWSVMYTLLFELEPSQIEAAIDYVEGLEQSRRRSAGH